MPDPAPEPALEAAEVAAYRDAWDAAPAGLAEAQGLARAERAGGVCLACAAEPGSRILNHAMGLGADGPADEAGLDAVAAFYAERGTTHIASARGALVGALRARGYADDYPWTRFARDASPPAPGRTDLRVREAGPRDGPAIGAIVTAAFGMPAALGAWLAAIPGRPGWSWFVACEGDVPAAVGALYAHGDAGWLGFGATRRESRGRGGQGAVMAARIARAHELGLTRIGTETGAPGPDGPGPSYRNILRAGFRPVEVRANLRAPSPGG